MRPITRPIFSHLFSGILRITSGPSNLIVYRGLTFQPGRCREPSNAPHVLVSGLRRSGDPARRFPYRIRLFFLRFRLHYRYAVFASSERGHRVHRWSCVRTDFALASEGGRLRESWDLMETGPDGGTHQTYVWVTFLLQK